MAFVCCLSTALQAANTIDTSCEWANVSAKMPKILGTTPVNMFLVIQKDIAFAHLFGTKAPTALPKPSLALFAIRDSHTVAASFLLPPVIGAWMEEKGMVSKRAHGEFIAQLLAPSAVQLISTPYHLIALDLYNRPTGTVTWADRWALVREKYNVSVAARVGRILPAFGVGGVANRHLREIMVQALEAAHAPTPAAAAAAPSVRSR